MVTFVSLVNCLPSNSTATGSGTSSKTMDDTLIVWALLCAGGAVGLAIAVYFGCIRHRDEAAPPPKKRHKKKKRKQDPEE